MTADPMDITHSPALDITRDTTTLDVSIGATPDPLNVTHSSVMDITGPNPDVI